MDNDITKSSIALLLVMAMIISVLSTMSIINGFENAQTSPPMIKTQVPEGGPAQGTVSLAIVGPEEKPTASGTISLEIIKGDNQ